jgi:nicotinate-nucleotide--dimethylbenzimidazole phosphoribosyltransferase
MHTCTQGVAIALGGTSVISSHVTPDGFPCKTGADKPEGMTAGPLDDIRALIATLPGPDEQARAAAAAALTSPGSYGRLEEIALWLAAWSGKARSQIRRPILALYAGAPGPGQLDAAEKVRLRLEAIAAGSAPSSRLAAAAGAGLEAFDLAIDRPIGDLTKGEPALSERECAATMAFGMEVLAKQPDVLLLGEIVPEGAATAQAVAGAAGQGLEALRRFGGREVSAAAGAILGARIQRIPVILDGAGPRAAVLALRAVDPHAADHCWDAEDLVPLGMRGSEGTAALAALSLVKLAGVILDPES